jgi:hypothetical protein
MRLFGARPSGTCLHAEHSRKITHHKAQWLRRSGHPGRTAARTRRGPQARRAGPSSPTGPIPAAPTSGASPHGRPPPPVPSSSSASPATAPKYRRTRSRAVPLRHHPAQNRPDLRVYPSGTCPDILYAGPRGRVVVIGYKAGSVTAASDDTRVLRAASLGAVTHRYPSKAAPLAHSSRTGTKCETRTVILSSRCILDLLFLLAAGTAGGARLPRHRMLSRRCRHRWPQRGHFPMWGACL